MPETLVRPLLGEINGQVIVGGNPRHRQRTHEAKGLSTVRTESLSDNCDKR